MSNYELPKPDALDNMFNRTGHYSKELMLSEIEKAEKRGEMRAKNLGECDECGTPYSFDPTDGGSICVRCLIAKLDQAREEIAGLKK